VVCGGLPTYLHEWVDGMQAKFDYLLGELLEDSGSFLYFSVES